MITKRPTLAIEGPGTSGPGPFDLSIVDGPPGGRALILYCLEPLAPSPERLVRRYAVPLFFGVDLRTHGVVPGDLTLDAAGSVTQTYTNPGGYEGMFAVQVLLLNASSRFAGTSTVAFL
jgi:hypothetical protein